jgi:type VI secretion system VasD/TssJ family lipoprotein
MRAAAVALLAAALGCKSAPTGPPRLCLNIEATSTLNLHDGEPHAVVLYLYPLDNATAFQETDASSCSGPRRPWSA